MYTVVLMMALSGGAETPADCWGCHGGCHGGRGCHGGLFNRGCHGGCHGGLFSRGCHGNCHGNCHGGYVSACHGCHGGYACNGGCHGGRGCHGGLFRRGCHGCNGGCHGGYACHGCTGGPAPAPAPAPGGPEKIKAPPKTASASVNAPATIVVSLPKDAKLTIDDTLTSSTSAQRVFASPSLEAGMEYYYTLKGEMIRDGQSITTTKTIAVHAGEQANVELAFPATAMAQN